MNYKKILLQFLLILFACLAVQQVQAQAQDTIRLKNGRFVTGKTLEVSDEDVLFRPFPPIGNDTLVLINIKDIRAIAYANGFTDVFKGDEPDTIVLVSGRKVTCKIAEILDNSLLARLNNGEDERVTEFLLDSVSVVQYASGYIEKYNPLLPPTPVLVAKAAEPTKQEKPIPAPVTGDLAAVTPTKEEKKKKEKEPKKEKPISTKNLSGVTITNKPKTYIAVGAVIDSASGLSRSVALMEILKSSCYRHEDDTLTPVLQDYPYNNHYAITGVFNGSKSRFKLYKSGKKVKEFVVYDDWSAVNKELRAYFETEEYIPKRKNAPVSEGGQYKFHERNIVNMLPGTVENRVPHSMLVDTFRTYAVMKFYKDNHAYLNAKEVYGSYTNIREESLFFFRNSDVPWNLKKTVRQVVFPISRWLGAPLTYLSCAYQLEEKKETGAALNLYFASLQGSCSLLASPYERGLLKERAYTRIHHIYSQQQNRPHLAAMFSLGADLNKAFLQSAEARTERSKYYSGIQQIRSVSTKAEDQAREIRATKRTGFFVALLNTAGAVATAGVDDGGATSMAFVENAANTLNESLTAAEDASTMLADAYMGIEDKIDTRSFTINDGGETDMATAFLGREIAFYLYFKPHLVKPVLERFAKDKPKMQALLTKFYTARDKATVQRSISEIYTHVTIMESQIIASEARGIAITDKMKANF
ncbi:hypothetical protein [Chitinophaga skermanii]|nr:hypothetical protein [Chitinophaga skermanii]